ncbi:MAG: formate--tetrahydrofolate ligase [SAR202 cluster bacterium]|nr:formate--tetrahydrofolate ligase [Chloroflexota bacterium]MDP6422231.1 formate--tetrahydrofolate ligase [SAR202 cluster bacterium]HAL49413.1 formate--tetrahydrofolate ligase [Dehalococcoidia bacterium]MDP6662689.1 formate--tetrahydrofolate ligase [SAR202 cluster bacterium]MQG57090.1 formate--tetrahydrofolate ligase [SAR202 cluster bacterium]
MRPIMEVAEELGFDRDSVIPYGRYKAKIDLSAIRPNGKQGKMVVITGMTPTPAGEGKTTTAVGLTQAMGKLGKKVVATLREPSLGPIFGIKGGGTGGGKALVEPNDEVNIHFTGDAHAVGSAHNLLAALTDNVAQRGRIPGFHPEGIAWRRVTDVEDRALRTIVTGIGGANNAPVRETGFDIVTASEIMAILALARDLADLRERLSRVVVGYAGDEPVTADDVKAVGSMMSLLRYAIQPNIVQTTEGQPVIVHAGPFGNIAHGCSSVVGDRLALGYADYVLTEAGFGADLGFEKFMHIKARFNGLEPSAAVLVASVRAVKYHGGVRPRDLDTPDLEAARKGVANLTHLVGVIKSFGLPVVVALNHFPTDTPEETAIVKQAAEEAGAHSAVEIRVFEEGGDGAIELGQSVIDATNGDDPEITYAYEMDSPIREKVSALARLVYNADNVRWALPARRLLRQFEARGWGVLPVCMAKTHLSISHRAALKGRPSDYTFEVSDVRASVGAGFIYPIAGSMMTMPGLPGSPRELDVDEDGAILGL